MQAGRARALDALRLRRPPSRTKSSSLNALSGPSHFSSYHRVKFRGQHSVLFTAASFIDFSHSSTVFINASAHPHGHAQAPVPRQHTTLFHHIQRSSHPVARCVPLMSSTLPLSSVHCIAYYPMFPCSTSVCVYVIKLIPVTLLSIANLNLSTVRISTPARIA